MIKLQPLIKSLRINLLSPRKNLPNLFKLGKLLSLSKYPLQSKPRPKMRTWQNFETTIKMPRKLSVNFWPNPPTNSRDSKNFQKISNCFQTLSIFLKIRILKKKSKWKLKELRVIIYISHWKLWIIKDIRNISKIISLKSSPRRWLRIKVKLIRINSKLLARLSFNSSSLSKIWLIPLKNKEIK